MSEHKNETTAAWIAEQVEKNPRIRENFQKIVAALEAGHLSLADVGGFAPDELEAAHACACHQLTVGEPAKALAVVSTLLLLDDRRAEFHLTAAIAMHHLQRWDEAETFYGRADALRPNDAVTLMYRGEARVLARRAQAGIALLRRGIALAGDAPRLKPYVQRATRILQLAETR
jgi:Flp pilus assembly protein TadD